MPPVLTRQQVRQLDRLAIERYGILGLVLMENAGRGATDYLCRLGVGGKVVVCCGKGNNAGDGFVIARHLELRGYEVETLVFALAESLAGDARTNLDILLRAGARISFLGETSPLGPMLERFAGAAWLIDALLGTGTVGEPRAPFDTVIAAMNDTPARRYAIDLPSGLDCDTGQPAGHTVRADYTCTFAAMKPGFAVPGASQYTGEVFVTDIGVPNSLLVEVASMGG